MSDRIYGVIPARGGSQGIRSKNLRSLNGKPLISYIAEAALASHRLQAVYISTEDGEIAQVAESIGTQVIRHPAALSTDSATTFGVIAHAFQLLSRNGIDILVTMRATSPLCTSKDIDNAIELLADQPECDAVISVVQSPIHPYRILQINDQGKLQPYGHTTEERYPQQRQSFETVYVRNGAIYASRASTIAAGGLWGPNTIPYIMPRERSVNINEEYDLLVAAALLNQQEIQRSP